jgi:hypothetical protein
MNHQTVINDVKEGRLRNKSAEELKEMLTLAINFCASNANDRQMAFCIERITDELGHRRHDERHKEVLTHIAANQLAIQESARQLQPLKRLEDDSAKLLCLTKWILGISVLTLIAMIAAELWKTLHTGH